MHYILCYLCINAKLAHVDLADQRITFIYKYNTINIVFYYI